MPSLTFRAIVAYALLFIVLAGIYGWLAYGLMSWPAIAFMGFSGLTVISGLLLLLLIVIIVAERRDAR